MPQSLNSIFGRNLRALCDERGTYAETARVLETNRIQLNRYFNGESFPKPNQLVRICRLFGVDSRIFTTPLEELRAQKALDNSQQRQNLLSLLERYSELSDVLPDGIHMMYRDNPMMHGGYSKNAFMIKRREGLVFLRGLTVPPLGINRRQNGLFSLRSWGGYVASLNGGFVFEVYGAGNMSFLTPSYFCLKDRPTPNSFAGVYTVFLPTLPKPVSTHGLVIEIIPQTTGDVLRHMRSCGRLDVKDIPEDYLAHLAPRQT